MPSETAQANETLTMKKGKALHELTGKEIKMNAKIRSRNILLTAWNPRFISKKAVRYQSVIR